MAWAEAAVAHAAFHHQLDGEAGERARCSRFILFHDHAHALRSRLSVLHRGREDILRRVDGALRIAPRTILVDQTVITNTNLSILF